MYNSMKSTLRTVSFLARWTRLGKFFRTVYNEATDSIYGRFIRDIFPSLLICTTLLSHYNRFFFQSNWLFTAMTGVVGAHLMEHILAAQQNRQFADNLAQNRFLGYALKLYQIFSSINVGRVLNIVMLSLTAAEAVFTGGNCLRKSFDLALAAATVYQGFFSEQCHTKIRSLWAYMKGQDYNGVIVDNNVSYFREFKRALSYYYMEPVKTLLNAYLDGFNSALATEGLNNVLAFGFRTVTLAKQERKEAEVAIAPVTLWGATELNTLAGSAYDLAHPTTGQANDNVPANEVKRKLVAQVENETPGNIRGSALKHYFGMAQQPMNLDSWVDVVGGKVSNVGNGCLIS